MTDDNTILMRNTMNITPGHLEPFGRAIRQAVEFVEANGPQSMVEVFVDEENLLAYSFQQYPDSAAVLEHWKLSDPHIKAVMEHCSVRRLDVYGHPDAAVVDGIREFGASGVPVAFHPRLAGFTRLSSGPRS